MQTFRAVFLIATLLLLAACGGTALKVSPDSASTTASGDTITLTASGGNGVTWSLSPELGSLSATSGASVTYTPPERVESTQTITVTASSGSASASATITVEPLIVDVSGVVLDFGSAPVSNVEVLIVGQSLTTTDAEGRFNYSNVIAPYTVIVQNTANNFYVYEGLTKTNPVIPADLFASSLGAGISGTVNNTTSGRALGISMLAAAVLGGTTITSQDSHTGYSFGTLLLAPSTSGRLYALEWTKDANNNAADFTGYGSYPGEVYLATGGSFEDLDIDLQPISSSKSMVVSVDLPDNAVLNTLSASVRFAAPNETSLSLSTHWASNPGTNNVTIRSPGLSGVYMQAVAFITEAPSASVSGVAKAPLAPLSANPANEAAVHPAIAVPYIGTIWNSVPATASTISLSLPERPEPTGPGEGASDVTAGTGFTWSGNPEALNLVEITGPQRITIITSKNSAQLPDLSAFGTSYNSGDSYTWTAKQLHMSGYCENIEQYTSGGMMSPWLLLIYVQYAFLPASAEGYLMASPQRSFTIR